MFFLIWLRHFAQKRKANKKEEKVRGRRKSGDMRYKGMSDLMGATHDTVKIKGKCLIFLIFVI